MKKPILQMLYMGALTLICLTACERRPLEEPTYGNTALVPVKIDWSKSGISVSQPRGDDYVHRVSIRFFPKDGSEVFDRYLENDVTEGNIEVPVGKYSVVVFNEAVTDPYWSNSIYFTDVNDYANFAANIADDDPAQYPFYTPLPNEKIIVEPLKLASWSLDDFEITPGMIKELCGPSEMEGVTTALTKIVMNKLTYNINVLAEVENLSSAQFIQGATRGFANKVLMASRMTTQSPSTHIFTFNGRKWAEGSDRNGTTEKDFLSFGLLPVLSKYMLHMDVLFVTGELHQPAEPLLYDVSDQANNYANSDINLRVKLALPYKEGGIDVGDWEDEDHIVN